MKVLRGIDAGHAWSAPTVVTVGKFLVVHRGHRVLLERVLAAARELSATPAVVTFDRHPLETIAPERAPHCVLASLDQRLSQLEDVGVEVVLLLEFTKDVAALEPEDFVRITLVEGLCATKVVVGEEHRFGHKHRGDVGLLRRLGTEHGFEVETVAPVHVDGEEVSSTAIRTLIAEGNVSEAARLTGAPYRIEGVVVEGKRRGRTIGFPTANLLPDPRLCYPAEGVYAGWWVSARGRLPGAINVGRSPTFGDVPEPKIEIHILDFDDDLYGERGEVEFTRWLRPDKRFDSVDALVTQIGRDAAEAREILGV